MNILLPKGWPKPRGYSNGISATGQLVFVAGQIGWNEQGKLAPDFVGQVRQALENVMAVLKEGRADASHVVRMTWYVTDKKVYLAQGKAIGEAYRAVMGNNYPTMSLVQVADLLEDGAQVEIEATAVIPQE